MAGVISKSNNWGDMLTEIVAKIRGHTELYDDYNAFSEVCSTWRRAIKEFPCQYVNTKHTQLPLLMLVDPDDSPSRRFYSLTKSRFIEIDVQPCLSPPQTRRYFSSQGWLISLSKNISQSIPGNVYFNITIFNPFSKITIETPLFHMIEEHDTVWEDYFLVSSFGKIVVSTCANNAKDGEDFVVALIFGHCRKVAYWRLGHGDTWVVPYDAFCHNEVLRDLYFFRGELYATQFDNSDCKVIAFGDLKDHNNSPQPRVVTSLGVYTNICQPPANMYGGDFDSYYLVESKCDQAHTSSLLVIHRFVVFDEELKYNTASFNVFKLNVDNGILEPVKSLGNQAIFVGLNYTFAVLVCANVDEDRRCKADCIYYTDDATELYPDKNPGGSGDMGIYSLSQGNTIPFYKGPSCFSVINPPTWIEFLSSA